MKSLNKILKTSTQKSKGNCDKCDIVIWEGDAAMCFHADDAELFLCESCIELIREDFIVDLKNGVV